MNTIEHLSATVARLGIVLQHRLAGRQKVFRFARRTLQKAHNQAVKDAGLPKVTVHDHRHTAAVLLARAGIPLDRLADQLGHGEVSQTMIYARYHPDYGDVEPYFDRVSEALGFSDSAAPSAPGPQRRGESSSEYGAKPLHRKEGQ